MSQKIQVGFIPFNAGVPSDFLMTVKSSILRVSLRITGNLVVGVAPATLVANGILNLVRKIEMRIGAIVKKVWGDGSILGAGAKLLYRKNIIEYGIIGELTQPAVSVGTNPFAVTLVIPYEMPPRISRNWQNNSQRSTCLSPTALDHYIKLYWGTVADVATLGGGGSVALTNCQVEVACTVEPLLDSVKMPLFLCESNQNVNIQAGINSNDRQPLNKEGLLVGSALFGVDNGVDNDASFNTLDFLLNVNNSVLRRDWNGLKAGAREIAGLQSALPAGLNYALFDEGQNGDGIIPVGVPQFARGWDLAVDHAALTTVFALYAQHNYLEPQTW